MAPPGRRPGGLTALSVLNFVMAGWNLLSLLGAVVVVAFAGALKEAAMKPEERRMMEALDNMNKGLWALIIVSAALAVLLLIAGGVGYLKMRKWGRKAGNLYAIISVISVVLQAIFTPDELGGGISIGMIIGLIYPILTLFFINMTFKEDLTN